MSVVDPAPDSVDTVYFGARLGMQMFPDLSARPSIRSVYANNNRIDTLYLGLLPPNVQHITLASNYLTSEGLLRHWPHSIQTLNLDYNRLTDTQHVVIWPSSLKELSLDENPMVEIPADLPSSLELLSMSYCNLETLHNLPPTLKRIRAYYNKIRMIGRLPQGLTYAHLAQNCLRSVAAFRWPLPPTLKYLNLDNNQITALPPEFPDSLETLVLANNHITEFPKKLPLHLSVLVLNNNRIRTFTPTLRPNQRVFQLHIRDNCLTDSLRPLLEGGWIDTLFQAGNWMSAIHYEATYRIQRAWIRYKIRKHVRRCANLARIYNELIATAMCPELITRYNFVESLHKWRQSKAV